MVHLHTHSMYSLRDSIIRPDELVRRIKELGQTAVAITDHGSSLGGVSIYKLLKEQGVKYIHGCELYICDDLSVKDEANKYCHLIVLCKNETGRINLNHLISISNEPQNHYFKPRVDFELLKQYKDGLIVSSACLAGEISKFLLAGNVKEAKTRAKRYKDEFGEDYYLEIQSHDEPTQIEINKQIVGLANELHIPLIVTCDAHYTYKEDRKYQSKHAFNGAYKEADEAYVDCYIQSEQEVREKLYYLAPKIIDEAIINTDLIAEKCNVDMPLSAPIMPDINTPQGYKDNSEWLHSICKLGFKNKLGIDLDDPEYTPDGMTTEQVKEYIDRYNYEFDALKRMDFIDYILLVYSYANLEEERGIARGSGGGSLVNYVSGITDIDPIEHGLYFERFIDVGALKLLEEGSITAKELKIPDVDLDFTNTGCKRVLKWLHDTYGAGNVASIGEFGTNQTKGTIRDMCKALGINLQIADSIAKSFGDYSISDIDGMMSGKFKIQPKAQEAIDYVRQYPELFEYVRKLNGLPKSFGLHACGKVISTKELDYFLPSSYDNKGMRYLQGDMHDVEDVGLVKIDLLGLRTIDQEYDTLKMTGENKEFISPKQRFDDSKVLDIFRNGDTVGIFQMSSPGMKQTLKKMDIRGIDDISVANALFRPGAIAYIDNFCRRRKGEEEFEYIHPDLEPILKSTYGIIVFQEQLIEIGRLAGINNPDILRKATGKKNPALMAKVKPELRDKLLQRGWSDSQFEKLWDDMIAFSRYSFNKSHSSAYSIIAYMTAKEKAYYPAEFYAGLCNSYIGESSFVKETAEEIFEDIDKRSVRIAKFDYKKDHRRCSVQNGEIVYAIPLIKDCSMATAETLLQSTQYHFDHFWGLLNWLSANKVPRNQIQILIRLGFFDEYGSSKLLLRIVDLFNIMKNGDIKEISKEKIRGEPAKILDEYCLSTNTRYVFTTEDIEILIRQFRTINKKIKESNSEELKLKANSIKSNIDKLRRSLVAKVMDKLEEWLKRQNIQEFTTKEQMATHKEYLGFINIKSNKEEDRRKIFVQSISPMVSKFENNSDQVWGYLIRTTSLGSGKSATLTVYSGVYKKRPFNVGSVLYATSMFKNKKGYWYLQEYSILEL